MQAPKQARESRRQCKRRSKRAHERAPKQATALNPWRQQKGGKTVPIAEKWYALQVASGKEDATIRELQAAFVTLADVEGFEGVQAPKELFSPRMQTARLVGGEYQPVQEPLLPGYVIAITPDVQGLNRVARRVNTYTRVLGNEKAFIPLSESETSWLSRFTGKGNRVVPLSEGFLEGGSVVVTAGPLVGLEAHITRINRRKREAYVSLTMMGRPVQVKVGFHLMKKA